MSQEAITELFNQLIPVAVLMGFIFGIILAIVIVAITLSSTGVKNRRDVKRYVNQLPAEKREQIEKHIAALQKELDTLCIETNTKYFKLLYNRIIYLQEYLKYREVD